MERRIQLLAAAILAALLGAATGAGSTPREQPEPARPLPDLLEEAIFTEETVGDLDTAIEMYEEIVARTESGRPYGARAQFRMAACLLKKGRRDEAVVALQKVVADFPQQAELVRRARARLTELGVAGAKGATVRRVWSGPDVKLGGSPSPDGRFLTARLDWELAVRDLKRGISRSLTKGTDISREWGTGDSRVSPDGQRVAYSWWTRELTELRVVGIDGGAPRVLYSGEVADLRPAGWSADGRTILASWRNRDSTRTIALVDAGDGSATPLKRLEAGTPLGLSLSPDGRYAVYDLAPTGDPTRRDVFVLSSDGTVDAPLVTHAASDFHPEWTPDGTGVVFLSDRGGSPGLWFVPVVDGRPGGEAVLLRPDTGPIVPLGFSRDGAFYYGIERPGRNVYVASIGSGDDRLTYPPAPEVDSFVGRNTSPRWSPDGDRLAYFSHRGSEHSSGAPWTLVVRTVETGQERAYSLGLNLYDAPLAPEWSPDGSSVAVTAFFDREGYQGFYVVDLESGRVDPLVRMPTGGAIEELAWSPDGTTVYYDHHTEEQEDRCVLVSRNLESGETTELARATAPWGINDVALSPDGRWLAYPSNEDSPRGHPHSAVIRIVPADSGDARDVYRVQNRFISGWAGLAWTRDGRHLLFVTGTMNTRTRRLWKVPVEGGDATELASSEEGFTQISLHPDGRRLAFSAGRTEAEVWVVENLLAELGPAPAKGEGR